MSTHMQEYQAGHVPGAVNLPLGPTLPDDLKKKYNMEEKLLIACQAGNRSTTAMQVRWCGIFATPSTLLAAPGCTNKLAYVNISMQALGGAFKNAVNYRGGFSAWAAAGMPVEK
jgi:rhodanese-related sulfurtransferase